MSLDYRLHNGYTNADVEHVDLFGFCVYMMATGVNRLNSGQWVDIFLTRCAQLVQVDGSKPETAKSDLTAIVKACDVLGPDGAAITTNVSALTDSQWRQNVMRIVKEKATANLRAVKEQIAREREQEGAST